MTPDLLHEAGAALYGPRWRADLADALSVSERTVRRWAAGEWPVPSGARRDIRALLAERGKTLASVRRRIPGSS